MVTSRCVEARSATVVLYVRREERTSSWAAATRFSSLEMRVLRASMPEYPVRSFIRCEAMKMLPCRLSIRDEKRLVRASRRLSCEEGRLLVGTSSVWLWEDGSAVGGISVVGGGLGASDDFEGSDGGLEESAKSRVWVRILHCRQVEVRNDGRLDTRRVRGAGDDTIESKKSLGTNRASGCMALLRWRLGGC